MCFTLLLKKLKGILRVFLMFAPPKCFTWNNLIPFLQRTPHFFFKIAQILYHIIKNFEFPIKVRFIRFIYNLCKLVLYFVQHTFCTLDNFQINNIFSHNGKWLEVKQFVGCGNTFPKLNEHKVNIIFHICKFWGIYF